MRTVSNKDNRVNEINEASEHLRRAARDAYELAIMGHIEFARSIMQEYKT